MTPEDNITWAEYEVPRMSVEDFHQEDTCTSTTPKKILVIGASSDRTDAIRRLLDESGTDYKAVFLDKMPEPTPHMTLVFDELSTVQFKALDSQQPRKKRNFQNYLRDRKSWKGRHRGY